MRNSGVYSIVLGLISIGLTIYLIEDQAIIISVSIILGYFSFKGYINQINKNTQAIKEFDKKLDLHNRLNKIENEIIILKG